MDYEKKYPITQQPGNHVLAQWERGYKQVELYYNDRLVGAVSGAAKLKKGVTLNDPELNTIRLKLSEKPVMLDLVIDGYHSPVNLEHPVKELKKIATLLWMLSALSLIAGAIDIGRLSGWDQLQIAFIFINLAIVGTYITASVLVGKGKPFPYFIAFGLFCLVFLFHAFLLAIGDTGVLIYIFMLIRVGGLVILGLNLKTVVAAQKHTRYAIPAHAELIDR